MKNGYRLGGAAVVLVCGLSLAGCSSDGKATADGATDPVADSSSVETDSQAGMAADFTLPRLDGETFTLSDSSAKVRLVDFWATWCAPCREEIPLFNTLQETYGPQGFEIIAISDEDPEMLAEFAADNAMNYISLVDDGAVSETYQIAGLPTAYLVNAEGRIVETFFGAKPAKILEKKIQALLAES